MNRVLIVNMTYVAEYLVIQRQKPCICSLYGQVLASQVNVMQPKTQRLYLCAFLIIKRKHRMADKRRLGT